MGKKSEGSIYIGTSGWHYKHWKGPFYPERLPSSGFLEFYQEVFETTELNNTFYQLPSEKTMEEWAESVADNFVFSVKANRYITHMKKLKDPVESLEKFFGPVRKLGEKLGPVIFQLPPNWNYNGERLENFLEALAGYEGMRFAFEFRDESWLNEECYELLENYRCAFCIYQIEGRESPRILTAPFTYLRLHGPEEKYQGCYSEEKLEELAEEIKEYRRRGTDCFCYFDNDENGYAPLNALRLSALVFGPECNRDG